MVDVQPDPQKMAADILAIVNQQEHAKAVAQAAIVPPRPPYIYDEVNEKTGDVKTKIDFHQYAVFLKNYFNIIYFNKTIYIYDHGLHFYRPQTNEIGTHVHDTVVEFGVSGQLKNIIPEVQIQITTMGAYHDYPFNNSINTIPVDNGILQINYDTDEIKLVPHSPEHLFTYKLAVKYNPDVKHCRAIHLLKRMVERDYIKTLIQIPAQALLQMQSSHSYKKAYLLQGEPHAGKTSYLKLLYMLFGNEFTTAISLQQLCRDRFVGGSLEGKLLNIYDDLEDVALEVIDQFKTLTGDCRHGIERKYEGSYTGKITAVHIFTCNYPPEYPDKVNRDTAFWTRWEYLKFPYSYPVNPNFYVEWYTDEVLSSFLNLILFAMIHIKHKGLLSNSDVQEVMTNWSVNSDPLYDFIESLFESYSGKDRNYYSKTKLYGEYIVWCNVNGIQEHKRKNSLKAFTVALQAHGFVPERKREKAQSYEVFGTSSFVTKPRLAVSLDYHDRLEDFVS